MGIKILTDSCCDLPISYFDDHGEVLELIGMPISLKEDSFIDDMGRGYGHGEYYNALRSGTMARTAQITPSRFFEIFERNHEQGHETLYAGLSAGISGTYDNACMAKKMMTEKHPDARIEIINTLSASAGLGVLVIEGVELAEEGQTLEMIASALDEAKWKCQHWFAVDNLTYLKNGGRIPGSMAAMGNMLNVKPVMKVDRTGKLGLHRNVRGRKKSLAFLARKYIEFRSSDKNRGILIGHGDCPSDALILEAMIRELDPDEKITVTRLSATIAAHVGPDMIVLAFLGEERV